jgi:hypothetical protein
LLGHPATNEVTAQQSRANEAAADKLALGVLALASEIPVGAVLWLLSCAYIVPSEGQYLADGRSAQDWQRAVQNEVSHPVTEERLRALVAGLARWSSQETRPAERATLRFIAVRLEEIARTLSDVELQQCMAVAARKGDLSVLWPAPAGPSARFLSFCRRGR